MASKNTRDGRLDQLAMAILEEMQFEQDLTDFREGEIDPAIHLPTFAEVKERLKRKANAEAMPAKTVFRQIPELLLTYLQSFSPQFQVQGALDANQFKSISVDWNEREVEIYVWRKQNGIAFYTPESGLVGKSLVIKGQAELKCRFIADDTTEGMKASGFIRKDSVAGLELNRNLIIGVED